MEIKELDKENKEIVYSRDRKLWLTYPLAILLAVTLQLEAVKFWFVKHYAWIHVFLIAFLVSFILTPEARDFSRKIGVLDYPNERKLQKEAVPLLGGMAIYAAFMVACLQSIERSNEIFGVLLASTLIFILGLVDDALGLRAHTKLLIQIMAVMIMTNFGWWGGTFKQIIVIIWVVGITNAFNYLDGMDGLAAGLAAIAGTFFAIAAFLLGTPHLAYLSLALVGACLGFLVYNFKPASVYMGDCGSEFIGFILASIGIMGGWYIGPKDIVVALSVPVLVLGILIFDMTMTSILRIKDGKVRNVREWLSYAGRDHVHHRMRKLLGSDKKTVFVLYGISLALGLIALLTQQLSNTTDLYYLLGIVAGIGILGVASLDKIKT